MQGNGSSKIAVSATIAPEYVDMRGIAIMAGVSRKTIEAWRANGVLPAPIRLPGGRLLRWRVSEIRDLLDGWAENPYRSIRA